MKTLDRKCMLLHDVDWQTYTRLFHAFAERPSVRLTYDRGRLEIMSPLLHHDNSSDLLGRLVVTLTEELGLPILSGGSTTIRRRKKQRGLEPDQCFWIANEAKMRGKKRLDLRVDPPPDLAVEVDASRSSLDRMSIYAALGVPEVWRLEKTGLTFHVLGEDRCYEDVALSPTFPFVRPSDLSEFLALREQMDENCVIRQFRDWIRHKMGLGKSAQTS